jgi:hypothetical protein
MMGRSTLFFGRILDLPTMGSRTVDSMNSPRIAALSLGLAAAACFAHAAEDPHAGHVQSSARAAEEAPHAGHGAMEGLMWQAGEWHVMLHGFANAVYDHQGGPRGDTKSFANSMLMVMASRALGPGSLELHAMLSLDPAMGRAGYPLLFQTGESADGRTHLVDRQHPHDAFMELAGLYTMPAGERGNVFVYAGLPGEPALGPPSFMHRFSGVRIPEAPLTHHWLDSTHITMGVVTLGTAQGPFKVEASRFNGREPDELRWNLERRRLDSWSGRVTFEAAPGISLQASYGVLDSPEALEPEVRVKRTTVSATAQSDIAGRAWGTTLAWGRNDKSGGEAGARKLDGWLLESTLEAAPAHTLFARIERVMNDELFGHHDALEGRAFKVGKASLGYIFDFAKAGPVRWGVGALASAYRVPAELTPYYGSNPRSYMLFLQARL